MLSEGKLKLYGASAGSGKTYTLVYEVLLLLLSNDNPSYFKHILAITFTNKAAAEMKDRLLDNLNEFASKDYENSTLLNEVSKSLSLSKETIHQKSKQSLRKILHDYSQFNISTIDTFNLRLMRAFSQDLGLSMNFDVDMDVRDRIVEAIDLVLSDLKSNATLTKAFTDIAIENMSDDKTWDVRFDLVEKTLKVFKDDFLEELSHLKDFSVNDLDAFRKTVNNRFFKVKNELELVVDAVNDVINSYEIPISAFSGGSRGGLGHYLKSFSSGSKKYPSNTLLKNISQDKRYAAKASKADKENIDRIWDQAIKAVDTIERLLSDYFFWKKVKQTVKSLMAFNEVEKRLNSIKEEDNFLLINEFNKIIGEHISSQPAPFIYERIGVKFNHYFIDEFQDTSTLQWNNFQPLVQNALATTDTVMLVGDPKQSIYRFRGGNPELMIDLIQKKGDQIEYENLETNYRSYDAIINFNNSFFTSVANELKNPDFQELYQTGNNQKINDKKGGFVKINFLEKPKNTSIEEWKNKSLSQLLEDIIECQKRGFPLSDMAILASKRVELVQAADYLSSYGIDVISDESLLLQNSKKIQLLIALIQFINNPLNIEYKADFIIQLYVNEILTQDVTQFFQKIKDLPASELLNKLKSESIDLTGLLFNGYTLLDKIELSIRSFGWDETSDAYVSSFLDELLKLHAKEPGTDAFLEHWENKKDVLSIKLPPNLDAIRLLTIHKSKGLQFPVVFLPFATFGYKSNAGIWVDLPEDEDLKVKRFYITDTKDFDKIDPNVEAIVERENDLEEFNALNLLYVAQTRAVEQLYINTLKLEKPKPIGASDICSPLYNKFASEKDNADTEVLTFGENKKQSIPKASSRQTKDVLLNSSNWMDSVRISSEHAHLIDENREEAIVYGNTLHTILENIESKTDINFVLNQFYLDGLINKSDSENFKKTLESIFEHSALKMFYDNPQVIWNERDFISRSGKIFRPDRVVKANDEWYLLDYKTGKQSDMHINQINRYVDEFTALGIKIRKAYIVYLGSNIEVESFSY